jgi:SSS family solute:Na+ symporter
VGTYVGTSMAIAANLAAAYPLTIGSYSFPGYTAFYTLLLNLVIAIVLTPVFKLMSGARKAADETVATDYLA